MKEVVFASAGAQDMDTSGYELSDLVNIAFVWKNPQIELDAVSRPGMSTPFSPTAFNDLEKGERGSLKNPIVVDEVEDKEKTVLQNSCVWASHGISHVAQKSFYDLTDWKRAGICLWDFGWIFFVSVCVYFF